MKNHQGELTPQSEIIGHNTALGVLGLTLRAPHSDWLQSKWQGELRWDQGNRKFRKGYSPALVAELLICPELEQIKLK